MGLLVGAELLGRFNRSQGVGSDYVNFFSVNNAKGGASVSANGD